MSHKKNLKKALVQSDLRHLIHPQHHPSEHQDPQVWVSGKGVRLTNIEGQTFIDGLSSMWNVYLGHGRKELAAAAHRQLKQLAFATAYAGATNEPAVELVKTLKRLIYPNIEAFYFTLGGSDATDTSIRTARFYWQARGKPGKQKIIARKLSYHGSTVGAASATGVEEFSQGFGPRLPGFLHIESPNPYRFTTTRKDVSPGVAAADLLEEAILREGPETVAAFIAEPVQGGGGGILVPQDDYFPRIRKICDKYNVLLISDEVITGFGRTGRWFALEHWGVQPDIVQFAKGITSGYFPLGGIGVSKEIKKTLDSVESGKRWWHGYTASAHPVGCAVALTNLRILEKERLVKRSEKLGRRLLRGLKPLEKHPHIGEVRGLGLLVGVEFVANKKTKERFSSDLGVAKRVRQELLARGVLTRVLDDVICLAPPLVISERDIDHIARSVKEAVTEAIRID
ncbi:MAG: aspartate aminotransferase family protein [Candidatus Omnitrophica bacterium]|nr:aspartate aminotransferase family protein [Candidatus Omnitrophota bacterium]